MSTKTLKVFEDLLQTKDFLRVHHSYLVNKRKIKSLIKGEYLLMVDGKEVPISRRRRKEVKDVFGG